MPVKTFKSYKEFRNVIESGKPIVVDFWASWCGPCKIISPVFERLSDIPDYHSDLEFWKCDVDEQQDAAKDAHIRAMPTFIFFKEGVKKKELVGANPPALQTLVSEAAKQVRVEPFEPKGSQRVEPQM
ncbi:putative thioredoxin family protein [Lyophyllum shimeji]|uniref:Thioredoxin n=1 Tax=Lyophyllum shimeji TaxID=47721 RepID=A0A9P3UTI7_LYOSH|nr:putative thioredoxin family protein [Lyophyllum shimeji]